MKATGVVRRIDDLGRVVIPKEIRKNLRIMDGESLEIFIDEEKNIILKKFSSITNLKDFANKYIEAIHNVERQNIIVTNRERIIAAAGPLKKTFLDKGLSNYLENIIAKREVVVEKSMSEIDVVNDFKTKASFIIVPIIVSSDIVGLVGMISSDATITNGDEKVMEVAATYIGSHIEA